MLENYTFKLFLSFCFVFRLLVCEYIKFGIVLFSLFVVGVSFQCVFTFLAGEVNFP